LQKVDKLGLEEACKQFKPAFDEKLAQEWYDLRELNNKSKKAVEVDEKKLFRLKLLQEE
jgi:hypothetical protein